MTLKPQCQVTQGNHHAARAAQEAPAWETHHMTLLSSAGKQQDWKQLSSAGKLRRHS